MNLNIIYIYLLLINILTFVIFGIDKLRAIFNKHRIKEAKLFYLCFLGGSIGSLLAIYIAPPSPPFLAIVTKNEDLVIFVLLPAT